MKIIVAVTAYNSSVALVQAGASTNQTIHKNQANDMRMRMRNNNSKSSNNYNQTSQKQDLQNQNEIKGIVQARNQLNQIYWRIRARTMRNEYAPKGKHNWIKLPNYKESIENVIGKAIADRITKENEFKGKGDKEVITFDKRTQPEIYTQENWNAVVLYNFINQVYWHCHSLIQLDIKTIFANLKKTIFDEYSKYFNNSFQNKLTDLETNITNAISTIEQYVTALKEMPNVLQYMFDTASIYDEYPEQGMCPKFKIDKEDCKKGSLETEIDLGSGDIPIVLNFEYNDKNSKLNWALELEKLNDFLVQKHKNETPNSVFCKILDLFDGFY